MRLYLLLILALLGACSKKEQELPANALIVGEWAFEQVTFRKNFSFCSSDVTSDFSHLRYEFKGDKTLIQTDVAAGLKHQGTWRIEENVSYYNEETGTNEYTQTLYLELTNSSTGQPEYLTWENLSVRKDKISCTQRIKGGTYTLVFRK